MLRFSVLVGISLLVCGAFSKPRSTWVKANDAAVQDTLTAEGGEKLPLGLKEVEPPEQTDVLELDIDPSMLIWKAVLESRRRAIEESSSSGRALPAGEHRAPYRPAEPQLTPALQPANGPLPPSDPEPGARYHQAEQDMDEVYHSFPDPAGPADQWVPETELDPLTQEQSVGTWGGGYGQAEQDLDELYHGDMGQTQVETQVGMAQEDMAVPGEREEPLPEEDLDDLYHKY